jgi:hypothetical protein
MGRECLKGRGLVTGALIVGARVVHWLGWTYLGLLTVAFCGGRAIMIKGSEVFGWGLMMASYMLWPLVAKERAVRLCRARRAADGSEARASVVVGERLGITRCVRGLDSSRVGRSRGRRRSRNSSTAL